MFRQIYTLKNVFLAAVLPLIILMLSFEAVSGEKREGSFTMYDEIRISSQDMDCDYNLEDYGKHIYNFEYPKLIVMEDEIPVVSFVDMRSEKIIFAEVSDRGARIINSIPSFGNFFWAKWPVIYVKDKRIYLAVEVVEEHLSKKKGIRIYLFDTRKNELVLQEERKFTVKGKHVVLAGIYPYKDKYVVVGSFSDYYFGIGWISGHPPTFDKNFSFILDGGDIFTRQLVEEEGRFGVRHAEYAVSSSGIIQSAWVRSTYYTGLSKHNETICYSENRDGTKWSKPIELYHVKESDGQISNLSFASYGNAVYLLWQDIKKGFYFAELKDGLQQEIKQLSDVKPIPFIISGWIESLSGGSNTKITVDHHGNVYALWVLNSEGKYQTFLKARINGKWTETIVVNSGHGTVKLPDMKVDEKGFIHVVYLKGNIKNVVCYYTKLKLRN